MIKNYNFLNNTKQAILCFIILFLSNTSLYAQAQEITLYDLDRRLIRLEETVTIKFDAIDQRFEDLKQSMDKRFENIDRRFENITQMIIALFVIFSTGMLGLVGFVLWDRRTFLKPFKEETETMKSKVEGLIIALREQAKNDKKTAQILQEHHLLH